jgi:O-antigen ligase
MSIRVIVCILFVLGFSFYAYRNWFVSLCASVVLMAFLKHPDMPRGLVGIPGANLWNLLIANVIIAWWHQRRSEGLEWHLPTSLKVGFWLYFAVITVSCFRAFINPTGYYQYARIEIILEYFLNSIRFLIPALLFYDGCRSPERVKAALGMIVLLYFLLAVQVIRYMGIHPDFSGSELSGRAARIVQRSIGYNRVDMSMMLAGASWAVIAFSTLVEKRKYKWLLYGAALLIVLGQALTGGRAGYVTWGAIGVILCTIKWRRLLPLIPLAAIIIVTLVPSVAQRMFSGFGGKSGEIVVQKDEDEITSGRNRVWPVVIDKIKEAPVFGYGRQAMVRTGLSDWASEVLHDDFGHPHEAYLEMLLDNGLVGFFCIMPLFFSVFKRSASLFLDRSNIYYEAAGGAALALFLALLFASFGAQTLYPREGVVGMWAAIGVAFRLSVERAQKRAAVEEYGTDESASDEVHDPAFADASHETTVEA